MRVGEIKYRFILDMQKSVRKIFKGNQLICEYDYDSFGNYYIKAYDENLEIISNPPASHICYINPFRWKSHYYDEESGLYYLNGKYYDPEIGRFINSSNEGIMEIGYAVTNPIAFPANMQSCFPSLPLVPEFKADENGGVPWWSWALAGLQIAAGIGLCFVPGGQIFGAGLIVGGSSMMASNAMVASGVNSQTASMIVSGLNVVAGIGMLFTPLAPLGATMIGSGIGSVGGGYISLAAGGSYGLGAAIGGIIGGIAGGYAYQGIQYARAYNYLRSNGLSSASARSAIRDFDGIPRIQKLESDTTVYRVWGGSSPEIGPWVSPIEYGSSARMMLALPPGNTAANTSTFLLSAGSRVLTGTVATAFNQLGGGIQWWYPLWTL